MYEVDYEHVINRKIGGVEVTIYFSKQKNEKQKEVLLNFDTLNKIPMHKQQKRVLDHLQTF